MMHRSAPESCSAGVKRSMSSETGAHVYLSHRRFSLSLQGFEGWEVPSSSMPTPHPHLVIILPGTEALTKGRLLCALLRKGLLHLPDADLHDTREAQLRSNCGERRGQSRR